MDHKYYKLNSCYSDTFINIGNNIIFKSLYIELYNTKVKIDKYISKWDYYKKLNNKYEYIYHGNRTTVMSDNIIPISRSYFKLREISCDFDISFDNKCIFCMAEAPGGFIKNILDNSKSAKIYANSLISLNTDIPTWKNIISNNINVDILTGSDNTGDICKLYNINNIIETIGPHKCDIITADGGIDFSNNYNNQELDSYYLILCEIYLAIQLQKSNGTFILKIFDIFYYKTIQLLFILNLFYDNVYIAKLNTSRPSNSEKYIICKNFRIDRSDILNKIKSSIINKKQLDIFVPIKFILNIYKYNYSFVNLQINNINNTIDLINTKHNNSNKLIYENLEIAKEWYIKYKL